MRVDTFKSRLLLALAALTLALSAATFARAEPRVLVELFTSQGCSSCPAADKLLGEIAKDPSILTMSLPVDYWDYLAGRTPSRCPDTPSASAPMPARAAIAPSTRRRW